MITWLRQDASLKTRLSLGFASVSLVAGAGLLPLIDWRLNFTDAGMPPADGGLDMALMWSGVGLVGSLALGAIWSAANANPVIRAVENLEAAAEGRAPLLVEAGETAGEGCVGRLAKVTAKLRDIIAASQQAERAAAETHAALNTAQSQAEAQTAQYRAEQRQVLESLAACLAELASGDLSARLNAALPAEYDHVRSAFNDVINGLHVSLASVAERVGALLAGAEEMSGTAADMARRTEQQAVTLKQTTAALGEITETVRKSSAGAEEANNVVSTARADAEKSGQVMEQAMTAMTAIERSATQISQIIGVIDEIAFQTNLLALNAGVEAARAGEAGRGFAVVASEVRGLAQRSAEAAKEIKTLITTSSQQVKSGVSLVAQAGDGLHRIVTQVGSLNALIAGLTDSAKAQERGLNEVNAVVSQMDQATQKSAAMVANSTTSGAALAREAEALANEVGARLGDRAPRRPQPARPAAPGRATSVLGGHKASQKLSTEPAKPSIRSLVSAAPDSAARPKPPARPAVKAVRTVSETRTATARQIKPATEPDDWSEF